MNVKSITSANVYSRRQNSTANNQCKSQSNLCELNLPLTWGSDVLCFSARAKSPGIFRYAAAGKEVIEEGIQKLYEIATAVSLNVYKQPQELSNPSIKYVYSSENKRTGFKAALYQNLSTGKYIVSYRGTNGGRLSDLFRDLFADAQMFFNIVPGQFREAKNFIDDVIKQYGKDSVELATGHSLGGSLAQMIGQLSDYAKLTIITLNAYGTKGMRRMLGLRYPLSETDPNNIYNFISFHDLVSNIAKHVGNSFHIKLASDNEVSKKAPRGSHRRILYILNLFSDGNRPKPTSELAIG